MTTEDKGKSKHNNHLLQKASKKPAAVKNVGSKKLKTISLVYLLVGLFAVGAVILFSSGIFDKPAVTNTSDVSSDQQNPHAGVDLNLLQQINDLEKFVNENPGDSESLLKLAHMLNDSGFYERAIELYTKYLSVKPGEADVIVDKGVCYFQMKNYDDAITMMNEAIKLNPKHQIAHFNLGIVNYSKNNIDEAKRWWIKTVELDPATDIAKKAQELINSN